MCIFRLCRRTSVLNVLSIKSNVETIAVPASRSSSSAWESLGVLQCYSESFALPPGFCHGTHFSLSLCRYTYVHTSTPLDRNELTRSHCFCLTPIFFVHIDIQVAFCVEGTPQFVVLYAVECFLEVHYCGPDMKLPVGFFCASSCCEQWPSAASFANQPSTLLSIL